jgi:mannitol/fructose-specific phosphotransferase system IIA component (Ntr-type)
VDFEAVVEVPVELIAWLSSPPDVQRQSLNILSCIARLLRSESLAVVVRSAATPEAIFELLVAATHLPMRSQDLRTEKTAPPK